MYSSGSPPMFRRNILPSFSGSNLLVASFLLGLFFHILPPSSEPKNKPSEKPARNKRFDLRNTGNTFLRKAVGPLPDYTALLFKDIK
jgi:hypothetical protein